MNALIELEATLTTLFRPRRCIRIRMFMEHMNMPLDVQDRLYDEISALKHLDQHQVSKVILKPLDNRSSLSD